MLPNARYYTLVLGLLIAAGPAFYSIADAETITRAQAADELDAIAFPAVWQADTKTVIWAPDQTIEMRGSYKRKGDLSASLLVMNLSGMASTMRTVQDVNQVRWTEMSMGPGQTDVIRQDLARIAAATGVPVGSAVSGNENPAVIWRPMFLLVPEDQMIEVSEVDGDPRLTFSVPTTEAVMKQLSQQTALKGLDFDAMTITVGREDGILRELRMETRDGSSGYSLQYNNVEVGVEIPDREFNYSPPAGAAVVDATQQSIQETRGSQQNPQQ